jgi:hypothetical protein
MSVYNYMLQAGVDEEEAFFFLNQPLIAEYLEREQLKESAYSKIVPTAEKGNVANNIVNEFLKNYKEEDLKPIYNAVNVSKLRYTINELKEAGLDTGTRTLGLTLGNTVTLSSQTLKTGITVKNKSAIDINIQGNGTTNSTYALGSGEILFIESNNLNTVSFGVTAGSATFTYIAT